MAVIQCPKCGMEVSDQSKHCPNCGFSIKVAVFSRDLERYKKEKPKTYNTFRFILIVMVISLVCWLLLWR